MATAVCGCSEGPSQDAAARPMPSETTVVQSLQATTQTVSASVEKSCFAVHPVGSARTFGDSAAALDFASAHLLPRWRDAPQPFDEIGEHGATRFFMRSMTRADVVAVRVGAGRWHIVGTGHC